MKVATAPAAAPPTRKPRPIGRADPVPYGMHKGTPIEEVPPGWLAWALRDSDFSDRHGFWGMGFRYPPRDAETNRFCNQHS